MNKINFSQLLNRYRSLLISAAIIAVLFALFLSLAPLGIGYALVTWLEGKNERVATIENVDFNPFTGKLLLEGVKADEPAGYRLDLPHLLLDVKLSQLFKKRLHVHSIELNEGFLEVVSGTRGNLRIAGLPEPDAPREGAEPSAWQVGVEAATMESLRVHGPGRVETFSVPKLRIEKLLQWSGDTPARIDTALRLGNASVALSGNLGLFSKTLSVDATLAIKSIDLGRLQKLLVNRATGEVAGLVSGNLSVQGLIDTKRKSALNISGSLDIAEMLAELSRAAEEPARSLEESLWTEKAAQSSAPAEQGAVPVTTNVDPNIERITPRQGTRISIAKARLADLTAKFSLNQDAAVSIDLTADTQVQELGIDSGQLEIATRSLRWTGKLAGSFPPSEIAKLGATGSLDISAIQVRPKNRVPQAPPAYSIGALKIAHLASEVTRSESGNIDANMTAEIAASKIQGIVDDVVLKNEEISWTGRLEATQAASGEIRTRAEGEFDSRLLNLVLPVAGLRLSQERARWTGKLDYRRGEFPDKPVLTMEGKAETAKIHMDSPDLGLRLLSLGSLAIDDVAVKGTENIHVRQVAVRQLQTVQQLPSDPIVLIFVEI
jgi:hypothetical protein